MQNWPKKNSVLGKRGLKAAEMDNKLQKRIKRSQT